MLFSDILGLESLKKTLTTAVHNNHVAHAQLFLGYEGSTALSLAWAYATFLSCENKQENDACGRCSSCVRYKKLIHPDLHFVFPTAKAKAYKEREEFMKGWREFLPKSKFPVLQDWSEYLDTEGKQFSISVAESRYISKILSLKAYEGGYKILILWLPEYMNASAANALLKGLEEPPKKTIFLLVSEKTDKILSTILSRCQLIQVPRYSDAEVKEYLISQNIKENEAAEIAPLVDGNLNEAMKLSKHTQNKNQEWFRDWMRLCFKHDYAGFVEQADLFHSLGKEGQKTLLQYALTILRESLISNFGTQQLIRTESETLKFVENFAKVIDERNIFSLVEKIDEAYFHLERNANSKIVFMDLSVQIARLLR
ncbi:ATP-binding protein [Bernardetia sp.]|uniref:DNA polymerase III subunit n=1 Tax=Bernardetia sp. TaxID=1937974 RepID=UPI0025C28F9C|nr:DNA polymerase III subunit delta' [Bernardetia sp.]